MKPRLLLHLLVISLFGKMSAQDVATITHLRPPATPLVACDPYFSIWSCSDHPAESWTRHWTGTNQSLCSFVRIDGHAYRLLGKAREEVSPMTLVNSQVLPTSTIYEFSQAGVDLQLTFLTPTLPEDLGVLSRPVTYISWQAKSSDGKNHNVALYFDASGELVVNTTEQKVVWSRHSLDDLDVLRMGSQDQEVLGKSGDNLRIDWGYCYVASPRSQRPVSSVVEAELARKSFVERGVIPLSDDLRMPRAARDQWPVMVFSFDMGIVGREPVDRFLEIAYDDQFSIEYFHRRLLPYWRKDGAGAAELLISSAREYRSLRERCRDFDAELFADLRKAGGEKYALLASLAFRQSFAAQKLVADIDGTPLLFPKENFSNGCIATVDVIYPASPVLLLFNAELIKATVRPVLDYAGLSRWKFPFAPHDLGTYPFANGQVYGGGEKTEDDQMPVEECGNMLILAGALSAMEGNAHFAAKYWPMLTRWAEYLRERGLDPENQLCTDDFAGHLARNVNLSAKAIVALGAYAQMCSLNGKESDALMYRKLAGEYARKWVAMADDGDHFRLAFDRPGTWSQKYNLIWDKILGLGLFPAEVRNKEIQFYKAHQHSFGLPLDNRKDYTKLDWILWTATLADNQGDFDALVAPVFEFAHRSPSRVPLTDWYDTVTGKQVGFQARSVVGGVFIKMLSDPALWRKWSHRMKEE